MFGGPGGFGQGPGGGQNPLEAFQMLFGAGGAGGPGMNGIDPRVLQEILTGGGMTFPGAEAQPQQGQPGTAKGHATAAATLRSLPKIKVTAYDIEVNESTECTICLDDLVVGQPALRIPCGHLYHEECVKDWLKKSNECPVCRYELPTDDKEYEIERRKRMAGFKLRMKRGDLTRKTAQELRRLADHIGVDVRGCLEKAEFVDRIANSSKVHILPDAGEDVDNANTTSSSSARGLLIYPQSQLEAMHLDEMKAIGESMGLDFRDCDRDRQEMIRRLGNSGQMVVTDDGTSNSPQKEAPAASAPSAEPLITDGPPLASRSVKELRQLAERRGVSLDGCLEKSDMVQRIQASQ